MYIKCISFKFIGVLTCSLILCKSVYSNGYVSWKLPSQQAVQRISLMTGENIVFYENHIDTLPQYTLNYDPHYYELTVNGHLFPTKGGLKAVFAGTGKVFRVDTVRQSIDRIDETYHHGYNFDSYQFVRKDTIFSFGGYGFWIQNNLLTFYSDKRKEWSVYSKAPFGLETPDFDVTVTEVRFYDRVNDILYVIHHDGVYGYDFKEALWQNYGAVSLDLKVEERYMVHTLTDTTCLIMAPLRSFWLYPAGNELADVTMENGANLANKQGALGFACAYSEGDELLVPKHSDKLKLGYFFESIPTKKPPLKSIKPLYVREGGGVQNLLFASFGLFTLFGILLTVYLRRRYLTKRGAIFDTVQWDILEKSAGGPLNTDDINELLGIETVSWEVQRRKRSEFIKQLNETSKMQLGEEVLLRERSEQDKRQVLYVLNPRLESALARLL